MPDPTSDHINAQFVHDADHDTQGGGCAGIVIVAGFWAGVAVGVLVSWVWRCL